MKTLEKNFVWNDFGKLTSSREDDKNIFIVNEKNDELKMSKRAYRSTIEIIKGKIDNFMNKEVKVRTSKSTKDWSETTWFSELELAECRAGTESPEAVFQSATDTEKTKIEQMAKALNAQLNEGDSIEVIVNHGHAMKMLALRHGIDHEGRGRLQICVKKHLTRNLWVVDVPSYGLEDVIVALAFERQNYYLVSIEPKQPELFRKVLLKRFNKKEAEIKNDARLKTEQLVMIYEKIISLMNEEHTIH